MMSLSVLTPGTSALPWPPRTDRSPRWHIGMQPLTGEHLRSPDDSLPLRALRVSTEKVIREIRAGREPLYALVARVWPNSVLADGSPPCVEDAGVRRGHARVHRLPRQTSAMRIVVETVFLQPAVPYMSPPCAGRRPAVSSARIHDIVGRNPGYCLNMASRIRY